MFLVSLKLHFQLSDIVIVISFLLLLFHVKRHFFARINRNNNVLDRPYNIGNDRKLFNSRKVGLEWVKGLWHGSRDPPYPSGMVFWPFALRINQTIPVNKSLSLSHKANEYPPATKFKTLKAIPV